MLAPRGVAGEGVDSPLLRALRSLSEASAAMLASRRSARAGVQPPARKFVELADFGTIPPSGITKRVRSRFSNEMEAYKG